MLGTVVLLRMSHSWEGMKDHIVTAFDLSVVIVV